MVVVSSSHYYVLGWSGISLPVIVIEPWIFELYSAAQTKISDRIFCGVPKPRYSDKQVIIYRLFFFFKFALIDDRYTEYTNGFALYYETRHSMISMYVLA
jgi:hypothetical protein